MFDFAREIRDAYNFAKIVKFEGKEYQSLKALPGGYHLAIPNKEQMPASVLVIKDDDFKDLEETNDNEDNGREE